MVRGGSLPAESRSPAVIRSRDVLGVETGEESVLDRGGRAGSGGGHIGQKWGAFPGIFTISGGPFLDSPDPARAGISDGGHSLLLQWFLQ